MVADEEPRPPGCDRNGEESAAQHWAAHRNDREPAALERRGLSPLLGFPVGLAPDPGKHVRTKRQETED